jgi:hypothetical protein
MDEALNLSKGKAEETSIEDQIKQMTPGEKSKMADRIYDHILKIMDRKIKTFFCSCFVVNMENSRG